MISIEKIDTTSRKQVKRFIDVPYHLYATQANWVPPLRVDERRYLNRKKFFYYEVSWADFFIARRDGQDVGRIAVLEHQPFNTYHQVKQAQFYLFECVNDTAVAQALFDQVIVWAKSRELEVVIGPKGFSALDGFGILIEGFEHRQMMNLTNYNLPYYQTLVEAAGFSKKVDLISCIVDESIFKNLTWLEEISEKSLQKAGLQIAHYKNKSEIIANAGEIIQTYNDALLQNWEYYPYSKAEISYIVNALKPIIHSKLVKVIKAGKTIVGVLVAFPDLSPELQRAKGKLTPRSLTEFFFASRKTPQAIAIGVLGFLPEYRLLGGNAVLITELAKTAREMGIKHGELLQIPDTAIQMRRDLKSLGIGASKVHRVYEKSL